MSMTETIQQDTERETASVEAKPNEPPRTDDAPQRVVPVTEAKKYRKRAQQAEQSLTELQQELETKSQRVTELEQTVTELERRSAIDELLIEADAIDMEAARLLTEAAVRQMDEPDAAEAVTELKRTKPFLFRASGSGATSMSARIDPAHEEHAANESIDHAAAEAHATGDRTDLLRYLRLRRRQR